MALVSTGLVFVAIALMLPAITARGARALRSTGRRVLGVEGFLGFDNVTKFPDRTALTATALAGTLAMMVASATIVEGFSYGTRKWMDEAFPFELAITASDFVTSIYTADVLPKAALDEVRAVEGVGIAYGVQKAFVEYEGQEVMLLAIDAGGVLEGAPAEGAERLGAAIRGSRREPAVPGGGGRPRLAELRVPLRCRGGPDDHAAGVRRGRHRSSSRA